VIKSALAAWLGTAIPFAIIDLIWLRLVAQGFYRAQLGDLRSDTVNFPAATAFYLIYVSGVVFFAVMPALRADNIWQAGMYGALLGFLCYATYDLTNLATLRNWPLGLTVVDIIWGSLLTAVAAMGGVFVWRVFAGAGTN